MYIDEKLGIEASNVQVMPNDPALQLVRNGGWGQTIEKGKVREVEGGYEQHVYDWSTGRLWFTVRARTAESLEMAVFERLGAIVSTAKRLYAKGRFASENIGKQEEKEPQLKVTSQCSIDEIVRNQRLINYNDRASHPKHIQLQDKFLDLDEENLHYPDGCRVVNICSFAQLTIGYYYASDRYSASFAPRGYVYYALKSAGLIKEG